MTKKASGSQVVAKSAAEWNQCPTMRQPVIGSQGANPLAE